MQIEMNKKKNCDWCGKPLGEVFFIDGRSKKKLHFNFAGIDCLNEFVKYQQISGRVENDNNIIHD